MSRDRLVGVLRCTLLPVVDVALFHAAFLAAYQIVRWTGRPLSLQTYYEVAWHEGALYPGVLAPLLAFYFAGLYRTWDEYAFAKGIDGILTGVAAAVAALLAVIWAIRDRLAALQAFEEGAFESQAAQDLVWGFPLRVLVLVLVLAPLLLWAWRMLANALERRWVGWSARPRRVLIAGDLDASDLARLAGSRRPIYRLVGRLSDAPGEEGDADGIAPHRGPLQALESVIEANAADEVVLVASSFDREGLYDAVRCCFRQQVRPRVVFDVYEALLSAATASLHGNVPLFRFQNAGVAGWNLVIKRLIDVAVSGAALLVAVPFLILPACVAIVIESKGWPVFSQERIGQYGRTFRVYKLRTMVVDAGWRGGPLTEDDDPRITRVGRLLRRTSVDELPQLWNVLRGDMSLVGPRAVVPYVADGFHDWERLSLSVKPGVTGLAQVSGRDEIGFREKSLLNLYYVRNYSVWLDLRILFDTVGVVLTMEGTGGTRGAAARKTTDS